MTRFVADAIAVRAGRRRSTFSARELRRDMTTYCETGVHPDIERAAQEHHDKPAENPLPEFSHSRPFIYFQFSIAKKPVGRVTVELFEDRNRPGVEQLLSRCRSGSQLSLDNTTVHQLMTDCAFFMGKPKRKRDVIRRPRLNHTDRGAVSVSVDGNEVAVTLKEDALALDETHHVVGRVHLGMEVLDKINDVIPGPADVPIEEIRVTKCGLTDHNGDVRATTSNSSSKTEGDTTSRHRQAFRRAQSDLKSALQEGISRKRKQAEEDGKPRQKKRILDDALSSPSSSDEES